MTLAEPQFIKGKSRLIAGLPGHFTAQTVGGIPALWQRLSPLGGKGRVAYGVVWNLDNPEGFNYLAGFEVANLTGLPKDCSHLTLPELHYAVFPHAGHIREIKDLAMAIFMEWLPVSGLAIAEFPHIVEHYGDGFDPKTGSGDIELWIPLR